MPCPFAESCIAIVDPETKSQILFQDGLKTKHNKNVTPAYTYETSEYVLSMNNISICLGWCQNRWSEEKTLASSLFVNYKVQIKID